MKQKNKKNTFFIIMIKTISIYLLHFILYASANNSIYLASAIIKIACQNIHAINKLAVLINIY